jgi:8-oxo-dGTP pyrophosphatase MutT (NUDIX family)
MTVAGALDARVEARLLKGRASDDPTFARALALAAIRETFEETGVVIGTPEFGGPQKAPAGWGAYAEQGCLPDLQEMHFICRAITPPSLPKRFDTRFFALNAKAIARQIDGYAHADAELVELAWVRLDKAEDYDLPAITRQVLTELRLRLASGMSFYAPTPFFRQIRNVWRREEL